MLIMPSSHHSAVVLITNKHNLYIFKCSILHFSDSFKYLMSLWFESFLLLNLPIDEPQLHQCEVCDFFNAKVLFKILVA